MPEDRYHLKVAEDFFVATMQDRELAAGDRIAAAECLLKLGGDNDAAADVLAEIVGDTEETTGDRLSAAWTLGVITSGGIQ